MIHPAWQIAAISSSLLCLAMMTPTSLPGQASLPATAPTAVTPSQLPSANPPLSHGSISIRWDGHLLEMTGNGETLSQVLNQIASRTGMHMTGTPPEDRIYGTYGPAPLVDVLSDLVSGLSINMLFVDRSGSKPADLAFTARNGAATPPNPSAPQQFAQQPPPAPEPPAAPQQPPSPVATSPGPGIGGATSPAATTQPTDTSTNPASPNGVKTPQEIFEQLQRLRANAAAQKQ